MALSLCLSLLTVSVSATSLLGVADEDVELYESAVGGLFVCDEGGVSIPFSAVNDDFCDCLDGSDEPGTSACGRGTFNCPNVDFHPKKIFSSFVNDGICDCCDGSDEYESKKCPNTCAALGEEEKKEVLAQTMIQIEGYRLRLQMIEEAKEIRQNMTNRIAELEGRTGGLAEEEAVLKSRVDELKAQVEAEKAMSTPSAMPSPEVHDNEEEAEARPLAATMAEVPVPAVPAADDESEHTTHDQPQSDIEPMTVEAADEEDMTLDDDSDSDIIFEDEATDKAANEKPAEKSQLEVALEEAEREHDKKTEEVSEVEHELTNLREALKADYGEDDVFLALKGKCVEAAAGSFSYEVCLYDRAKQNPGGISLGGDMAFTGTPSPYSTLSFTNGTPCWKGPSRALTVQLHCGLANQLSNVEEPQQCLYTADLHTPAACFKLDDSLVESLGLSNSPLVEEPISQQGDAVRDEL